MGTLIGHVIPGTFMLFWGWWWAVGCILRYFSCKKSGARYVSTPTFQNVCCKGIISRLPVESVMKVILSAVASLNELIVFRPVSSISIEQHATMYLFFLLSGVVDLCIYYGLHLPSGSSYGAMVLAFVMEGLLFTSHVHGRPELDAYIHQLLVYIIFLTALVIALEMKFKTSILLGMTRSYLTMLQGSWFFGVGIILYGHKQPSFWDHESHTLIMYATLYFCWHCAVHLILLVLFTLGVWYYNRKHGDLEYTSHDATEDVEQNASLLESSTKEEDSELKVH
ncbi:transmembrane protein 45B [Biomphalaria glabrata]